MIIPSITIVLNLLGFYQIENSKYILLDSTMLCCESGNCDYRDCHSDSVTVGLKPNQCSPEPTVSCIECVNAIRYNRTCNQPTEPYTWCFDNEVGGVRYSSYCGYEVQQQISISGPGYLAPGVNGYFSSQVTLDCSPNYPNHYQWYLYYPCSESLESINEDRESSIDALPCGVWDSFGSDTPTISRSDTKDFWLKCYVWNNFKEGAISNIWQVTIVE
ncbi:MAG: hypothetical protein RDU14_03950 [Melioribacteraceae bacterium]|nr:hypothetical protein [Melioribacteraceae bacterium]